MNGELKILTRAPGHFTLVLPLPPAWRVAYNWKALEAILILILLQSSMGRVAHVRSLCEQGTTETGLNVRENKFGFSTVARYTSRASCFLSTEMVSPLYFFGF
jgi:hypothetical protein